MEHLNDLPYPAEWDLKARRPGSPYYRPGTFLELVTREQKLALYNRRITTRELAKLYGVTETYVSELFPGKVAPNSPAAKRELSAVRMEYRLSVAAKVVSGDLSIKQAALQVNVHQRTISRAVQKLKEQKPKEQQ